MSSMSNTLWSTFGVRQPQQQPPQEGRDTTIGMIHNTKGTFDGFNEYHRAPQ